MNKLKIFALAMICLLIIAAGLRFVYLDTHSFKLNEDQKVFAINAAQKGLKDEMANNNYNATVQEHGRIVPSTNGDKKVVRVVLTNGNTTWTALVDMDTGNIVEKSMVEHSGWMTEPGEEDTNHWGHHGIFNR
ncbi:MAG: hypothetical protein J5U17_01860 [Candidatus Methanoperedens sp.]|nr:hypothetical protein [Candidatus Methanoperedens sp.]MCE8424508.1 hypothetical protein [Candidatus Methanoperedens sp.]MCE8426950.1 hypothetical protein [Candidatus Methanoperedens sp.]